MVVLAGSKRPDVCYSYVTKIRVTDFRHGRPKTVRITYIHQYFNTPTMSGPMRSYELARRLVAKGHTVNMLTTSREGSGGKEWTNSIEDGIQVHWLPVPYSNAMGLRDRFRAFMRFAMAASKKAASLQSDIIYATSTPLTVVLPAAYASSRRGVPFVFEVRDIWPDVPVAMGLIRNRVVISLAQKLELFAYNRAASIVVLAPTMASVIHAKGVIFDKISAIPNGADPERFAGSTQFSTSRSGDSQEKPVRQRVLLYCGSLGPAHEPEYLVSLAEALLEGNEDVRIDIVGEGKMLDDLVARAARSGCLDKTIRFLGTASQSELPGLYAQADATIMTMADCELLYRHSVQNKFFESLAAGLPVFANYRGWASQVAADAGAGLILPRHDIASAATMLSDHIWDDDWCRACSVAARSLIHSRFNFDLLADQLEVVLIGAVEKDKGADSQTEVRV
jgi:glycosyltransferase involved in cell wall biosynthesis